MSSQEIASTRFAAFIRFAAMLAAAMMLLGGVTGGLVACMGRPPNPVAVVQPQDQMMDCTAIYAEIQANNQRVCNDNYRERSASTGMTG